MRTIHLLTKCGVILLLVFSFVLPISALSLDGIDSANTFDSKPCMALKKNPNSVLSIGDPIRVGDQVNVSFNVDASGLCTVFLGCDYSSLEDPKVVYYKYTVRTTGGTSWGKLDNQYSSMYYTLDTSNANTSGGTISGLSASPYNVNDNDGVVFSITDYGTSTVNGDTVVNTFAVVIGVDVSKISRRQYVVVPFTFSASTGAVYFLTFSDQAYFSDTLSDIIASDIADIKDDISDIKQEISNMPEDEYQFAQNKADGLLSSINLPFTDNTFYGNGLWGLFSNFISLLSTDEKQYYFETNAIKLPTLSVTDQEYIMYSNTSDGKFRIDFSQLFTNTQSSPYIMGFVAFGNIISAFVLMFIIYQCIVNLGALAVGEEVSTPALESWIDTDDVGSDAYTSEHYHGQSWRRR